MINSEVSRFVSRESIEATQSEMAKFPQSPGMTTTHFFAGGMYCRRIEIPEGALIVSKVHKTEHLFIGCVGSLFVAGQGSNFVLEAGDIVSSPIGTKRAVRALTDVVVLTVHKTDNTSIEELERELVEHDPEAMYDFSNQPKPGVLVHQPEEDLELIEQQQPGEQK